MTWQTKLLAALVLVLGTGAALSLVGADQKPLVINPTTGKTEQMQAGNTLIIPGATGTTLTVSSADPSAVNFAGGLRLNNGFTSSAGDLGVARDANTGAIYFGINSASRYLFHNGSSFIFNGGKVSVNDTTDATSSTVAGVTTLSGLAAAKSIFSGGNINAYKATAQQSLLTQRAATTGTTLGDKDGRLLFLLDSGTVGAGGEVVLGATTDTATGRYASISSSIVTNASGAASGGIVLATKALGSDTSLTPRLTIGADGLVTVGNGVGNTIISVVAANSSQSEIRNYNNSGNGYTIYRPLSSTDLRFFQTGTVGGDVLTLASTGEVSVNVGNITLSTVGKGILIKEGTNAKMGIATLAGGTVTVNTTAVTANSRIFLTNQILGTVAVASGYAVTARTAATSFTITASIGTDTSQIAWMIVEPAP